MNRTQRRWWLYGSAAPVLGVLAWAGFLYKGSADVGTLLSSVEIQLRLAGGMPATDKQGRPLQARTDLIGHANVLLVELDRRMPRSAQVWEYKAFVAFLEQRFTAAAELYAQAQTFDDCDDELRAGLHRNEARMWLAGGAPERARATLRRTGSQPCIDLGFLWEAAGDAATARDVYQAAAANEPLAHYDLARLAMRDGDGAAALDGLERAAEADAAAVRARLLARPQDWEAVRANPRWQRLVEAPAEPGR
jgi:tetratricopeptide (TPR) repeat protein